MVTEMTKLTALTSSGGLRQCSNFNKSKTYSGLKNGEGKKNPKLKAQEQPNFWQRTSLERHERRSERGPAGRHAGGGNWQGRPSEPAARGTGSGKVGRLITR